ncbi:MAG: MFS transporter [Granulosicoccus sp.]|nr:MFS transporter [Granulosicoccus sp.]
MTAENSNSPAMMGRWVVLAGVWFLYFSFGLVVQSMAPLVDVMIPDLGISRSEMGTILGAWQFVYLFAAIPMSLVLERFGEVFALSAGAFLIASSAVLRGFAPDPLMLWMAVAIFGLGGPLISIGAPKVISQLFGSQERGFAMGIYMTGPALGGIVSLMFTNSVLMPMFDHQWRSIFLLYAGIALLSAFFWLLVNRHFRLSTNTESQEARSPVGTAVYWRLLKNPMVATVLIMSIGIFTFTHGLNNWLPAILVAKGMTPVAAGYWASVPAVIGVFASLTVPRLARSGRQYLIFSCLCLVALVATLALFSGEGYLLMIGLVAQGVARGALMTLAILVLMESRAVGSRFIGAASGLFFTLAEIGGVAGPVGIGVLADRYGHFDASLYGLVVVCVLLILLSLIVRHLGSAAGETTQNTENTR